MGSNPSSFLSNTQDWAAAVLSGRADHLGLNRLAVFAAARWINSEQYFGSRLGSAAPHPGALAHRLSHQGVIDAAAAGYQDPTLLLRLWGDRLPRPNRS